MQNNSGSMHLTNYPGPSSHDPYSYHPSPDLAHGPSHHSPYFPANPYNPRKQRSPRLGNLPPNPDHSPFVVGNNFSGSMAHSHYGSPQYRAPSYAHDASQLSYEQLYHNLPSDPDSTSYPSNRNSNQADAHISPEQASLSYTQGSTVLFQASSSAINPSSQYSNATDPLNSPSSFELTKVSNLPNNFSVTPSVSQSSWIISPFRPSNPSDAYAITISPKANPPPNIVHAAVVVQTLAQPPHPLSSFKMQKKLRTPESNKVPEDVDTDSSLSSVFTKPRSSSATESTHTDSAANNTSVPDSPQSSHTSISGSPKSALQSPSNAMTPLPSTETIPRELQEAADGSKSNAGTYAPAKKSWAALLKQGDSSDSTKGTLPRSSVVGFSIPASENQATIRAPSVSPGERADLKALLIGGSIGSSWVPQIRPRGLVNTGNICFANVVLQSLVYCTPFHRLLTELGKYIGTGTPISTSGTSTPLVEATAAFLKEFEFAEGGSDDWLDSFIPTYLYEALKDNKRFDSMRVRNTNGRIVS